MTLAEREAANFRAIKQMRDHHNATCPLGPAIEVHMAPFDICRLQWEEGDTIAGLLLVANPRVQPSRMKVLCAGDKAKEPAPGAEKKLPQPLEIIVPEIIPDWVLEPAHASGEVRLL